jgi:hypothetical protein
VIEKNSKPHIRVATGQGDKTFAPEEISAMVSVTLIKAVTIITINN